MILTKPKLSRLDHSLLRLGQRLVPVLDRADWLRSWQAELWYLHARTGNHSAHRRSLSAGLLRDALWLRTNSWRTALSGTALLCLLLLTTLVALAALPAFIFAASGPAFASLLWKEFPRFATASALILFVSYANAAGSLHPHIAVPGSVLRWFRARAFFAAKITLLLLLAFLISADLTLPLEDRQLFVAVPLQMLFFVILALLALRWSFHDGEHRCKHCLRSLTEPARVGRPSWNFLEYNGTELACRDGHGLLTVPEIETSWCQSSAWIPQQLP